MQRQTFIFLLSQKITTVQSKTAEINNHINQPQNQSGNTITTKNHSTKYYQKQQSYQSATKTTTTINPRIRQTKTRPKQTQQTNTKNHLVNQSQNQSQEQPQQTTHTIYQSKTPKDKHNKQFRKNAMFLNIKISQTATASEPTANKLFIKTQRKYTRQPGQLQFGTRYNKHENVRLFVFR